MIGLKRTSVLALAALAASTPALADVVCAGRDDMHALQMAVLQQKLMVAALTCHDTKAYNAFVLGHRPELQKSDANLLLFFKQSGKGSAGYHAYKTRLANSASLDSMHDGGFCGQAHGFFARAGSTSLNSILDRMPTNITGFAACDAEPVRTAQAEPPRVTPHTVVTEPVVNSEPEPEGDAAVGEEAAPAPVAEADPPPPPPAPAVVARVEPPAPPPAPPRARQSEERYADSRRNDDADNDDEDDDDRYAERRHRRYADARRYDDDDDRYVERPRYRERYAWAPPRRAWRVPPPPPPRYYSPPPSYYYDNGSLWFGLGWGW